MTPSSPMVKNAYAFIMNRQFYLYIMCISVLYINRICSFVRIHYFSGHFLVDVIIQVG